MAPIQALDESRAEVYLASGHDPVVQQLKRMMTMIVDLTSRVKASEDWAREKATTRPVSPSMCWTYFDSTRVHR